MSQRRHALRVWGWLLLGGGAVATLVGAGLVLLQPTLPWADDEPRPQIGAVTRDIDPDDTVAGPVLLVGLEPEADPDDVLAEVGADPVAVEEPTSLGLRSVAFADEDARDRARRRLADHEAVRVLHQPDELDLNDASSRTQGRRAGS